MGVLADARNVLLTADPREKAAAARKMRNDWVENLSIGGSTVDLPDQPARPTRPELVPPSKVSRRRLGSAEGRGD